MSGILFAKEYLITYRYTVKDAVIYNEKLSISRAMTPCKGELVSSSLIIAYPQNNEKSSLDQIILNSFDEFFSYISKVMISVDHRERTSMMQNSSFTKVLFPTTCFKVDFNDSFVTITAIKK
ncbi:MAG: hypothetical protein GXO11_06215 [Epsilonproteobacteria bacterium]|nr:hypothetical protein [Campylobacterota bacterium]